MRPGLGSLDSLISSGAQTRISAITGRLIRKTEPQKKRSRSRPPRIGPKAAPAEKAEAQTATAIIRCRWSGKRWRISESVEGIRVAPATPSRARARISISAETLKAATAEAAPKAAEPIISRRRRPIRSPSEPMVTRRPAIMNP